MSKTKLFENVLQGRPRDRRRIIEFVSLVVVTVLLLLVTRLETRIYRWSEQFASDLQFYTTIVYFGLINLNVILLLLLCYLIFRNVAKLIFERKHGVFGSNLKYKLVVTLALFAIAPTLIFFYISTNFISSSFERWFSDKVRQTIVQTEEAGRATYERDRLRLETLAKISLASVKVNEVPTLNPSVSSFPHIVVLKDPLVIGPQPASYSLDVSKINGFASEYKISSVKVYTVSGYELWPEKQITPDPFWAEYFSEQKKIEYADGFSMVMSRDNQDVVKGVQPIRVSDRLIGWIVTENIYNTQIIKSLTNIRNEFSNIRPSAQYIKLSYKILLVVMAALILFSAIWAGFYVARNLTNPIRKLAEATNEVALGNYKITLQSDADDEVGLLVDSFNQMTKDLQKHKQELIDTNNELNERRKLIEVVFRNISSGVISVDHQERVVSMNLVAERLLGTDQNKAIGQKLKSILPPDIMTQIFDEIQESQDIGSRFTGQFEYTNQHNGQTYTFLVHASKIFDRDGYEHGTVIVFDDASDQIKAQKVAAWKEVARRIAHEIKNPLTPIRINAERVLKKYLHQLKNEDQDVFKSCMESILYNVDSMKDLVNEFSKFSKLPSVRTKLQDLSPIIIHAVKFFRLGYPHIDFVVELSSDLPKLELDRDQMNRMLLNVFSNSVEALRYTKDSKIIVKASVQEDLNLLSLEIDDNGRGIADENKGKVMEPYFSTRPDGSGLGLAIVHQIITDHGGYLRIQDSDTEFTGTKVLVELPIPMQDDQKQGDHKQLGEPSV